MWRGILILFATSSLVSAQVEIDKNFELGKSFYDNGNIEDADYYLRKSLYRAENSLTHYYLGLVNIKLGAYNTAKSHFSKSQKSDSCKYHLALIEKLKGNYANAGTLFENCLWKDATLQKSYCVTLEQVKSPKVRVRNLQTINTSYSEVSPAVLDSKVFFSSNREHVIMKRKDIVSATGYYDFYESLINNNSYEKACKSSIGVNTGQHELQPTFNSTSDTLYYCHSLNEKDESGKAIQPKLYRVRKENKSWTKPKKFLLNDETAAFSHPHISEDGNLFFFSSDMDGGYGGADLYVCYRQDTSWSFPINLGPEVNTSQDEISPFLSNQQLVFASNGHASFGGYDIFYSNIVNGLFQSPKNVGKPINSSFNDTYPVIIEEDKKWLIVSDRLGGKGKEDIYEIRFYQE